MERITVFNFSIQNMFRNEIQIDQFVRIIIFTFYA